MLGARAEAMLAEVAACLAEYSDVLERPGLVSVSFLLTLDSGGRPHTDRLRPEFKRDAGEKRRRREPA